MFEGVLEEDAAYLNAPSVAAPHTDALLLLPVVAITPETDV